MAKIITTGKRNSIDKGSFRRWVKQLFVSLLKRQNDGSEQVLSELQDIRELIESVAREIVRQGKRGK
jgi:hypothetical protein